MTAVTGLVASMIAASTDPRASSDSALGKSSWLVGGIFFAVVIIVAAIYVARRKQ